MISNENFQRLVDDFFERQMYFSGDVGINRASLRVLGSEFLSIGSIRQSELRNLCTNYRALRNPS